MPQLSLKQIFIEDTSTYCLNEAVFHVFEKIFEENEMNENSCIFEPDCITLVQWAQSFQFKKKYLWTIELLRNWIQLINHTWNDYAKSATQLTLAPEPRKFLNSWEVSG